MLCGSGSKRDSVGEYMLTQGEGEVLEKMGTVRELREFLLEAELEHYYSGFKNELKIATVPQIKYVAEEDLVSIGMTKPEMRRLKKFYKKECPQGKLEKFKRALMDKAGGSGTRTLSPSPPDHRISRPISYIRPTGKQIISSDSIDITRDLGEGEFGVVQQGLWTTEEGEKVEVAIKCLSRDRLENGTQEFLKEAGLMQTIDHENIVRMYGVVLDKENSLMLVTELAPMRSLLECLKDILVRQEFTLPRLCDFAQQICDGMSYLESKRLIHRDLAARNILVFSKSKVKISDFGLSRALGRGKDYYQSNFSINLKLPIAWCAPECINYLKFTSSSDIWAYGVTLWELFTYGAQPWAGRNGQQILDAIDSPNHQRLEQPELCPRNYYDLMQQCWDAEPDNRPTFSDLFITLPQMRPTQVKAIKDFPEVTVPKDYIYYRAYDVITVLDKTNIFIMSQEEDFTIVYLKIMRKKHILDNPANPPVPGMWKGVLMNGKSGFFDPCNMVPFIEPKSSPGSTTPKKSIMRRDSKKGSSRKLRTDMISRPQNDLRHTGHIGYDGAIFGDVGFIGDNYDKLPVKTASIGKLDDSRNSINLSRMSDSPDKDMPQSLSDSSLNGHRNGYGKSWISIESLESTRQDEADGDQGYLDIDDDSLLADFKMPDLSTSLDFGGSFMDEVLKALSEKEAQIDSSPDKESADTQEDVFKSTASEDRGCSVSPSKDLRSPPPLPPQPPRAAPRRLPSNKEPAIQPKQEPPRLQAKVKPMSTSDEKMMEEAINMANRFDSHSRAQEMQPETVPSPERLSDAENAPESPKLISKIKASIRRSPKQERTRTFSDSLNRELTDDVPPEAQAAYNMLVVHGSVKDSSRSYTQQSQMEQNRESLVSNGSLGHNFAYADSSSSSVSQTPERSSPVKSLSRRSSERGSCSPPRFVRQQSEGTPDRPIPRPRVEPPTPPKRGEPPVPRPRPEILRVEPTPRPPPPPIPGYDRQQETNVNVFDNPLVQEGSDRASSERNSQVEILRVDLPEERMDRLNTSYDSGRKSTSPSDESQSSTSKFSFFDEEINDPSPREIMSKLARESRLRRSLDHQRGASGEGDAPPNRNLREPQGIPTKTAPPAGDAEEEVDTNPLRMLRGGVIPVRGGRGGSGMTSNKPTLRHPKLHFTTSTTLQHSLSVDAGRESRDRVAAQSLSNYPSELDDNSYDQDSAPAVPPRSFSVCDNHTNTVINPIPLPPRTLPRRAVSLTIKPRERKYPLPLDHPDKPNNRINININPANSWAVVMPASKCVDDNINACSSRLPSSGAIDQNSSCDISQNLVSKNDKYSKPYPLPDYVSACKSLHEIDSSSLADLPQAPPPPTNSRLDSDSEPDEVFEPPDPQHKTVNLSRDGGSSGASTFPRGFKMYGIQNVKCDLEQLGFYNGTDPFWVKSILSGDGRSYSDRSEAGDTDASPLMLANYKCTEGVSYEDLLDFALDREKNGEEVNLMQKLFGNDVTREDCVAALEDTKWDLHKAIKYIKLKQLLSIQLGDVSRCKEALLACNWNVQSAADYMLGKERKNNTPPSPECVDV